MGVGGEVGGVGVGGVVVAYTMVFGNMVCLVICFVCRDTVLYMGG